ncbi:hypothetical protein [Niabella aurantiaca]|uniref:hypothetical protein n=1 Tax=Niabella aurantiaca TaxID=379900 RepID=UPI00036A9D43|nr:hypothetical protein [Niabella aurantiaca]
MILPASNSIKYIHRCAFFILASICLNLNSNAQLNKLLQSDIDNGSKIIEPYISKKMNDSVRLVGLGELQIDQREPILLNAAIAAYLIQKNGFNTYLVDKPDWVVRNFNEYIIADDKAFSQTAFDTIFSKTFAGSRYFNTDFKSFALWLKKFNAKQKTNKVRIKGVGFLVENVSQFPIMNNYFIEKYVRPYNKAIADSMHFRWEKAGNSNTVASDSVVIAYMKTWQQMVEKRKLITDTDVLAQMNSDIADRTLALSLLNSKLDELQKYNQMLMLYAHVEKSSINELMKNRSNKIIFSAPNTTFTNSAVFVYDVNRKALPIPTNGAAYRETFGRGYVNTVVTFSDSANVIGIKGGKPYQPTVADGDELTKKLILKKGIYYLPENSVELSDFKVPTISTGTWGKDATIELEGKSNAPLFDVLFIFHTITKSTSIK